MQEEDKSEKSKDSSSNDYQQQSQKNQPFHQKWLHRGGSTRFALQSASRSPSAVAIPDRKNKKIEKNDQKFGKSNNQEDSQDNQNASREDNSKLEKIKKRIKTQSANDSQQPDQENIDQSDEGVFEPSQQQLDIIKAPQYQNIKIMGCAGSGKTLIIIHRIKHLLDIGVKPSQILVFTFDKKAGQFIKNQLNKFNLCELKSYNLDDMFVGNMHKITFQYYNQCLIKPEPTFQECFAKLLAFYQSEGQKEIEKCKYLFFDEFSEINNLQYKIFQLFCKKRCQEDCKKDCQKCCKIMVLGDDVQTIFGWRGAEIVYFQKQVHEDVPHIVTYKLNENRRSTPEIVSLSNALIEQSENLKREYMIPQRESFIEQKKIVKPIIYEFDNECHQENVLLEILVQLIYDKNVPPQNIGILTYQNDDLEKMESTLKKYNDNNQTQKIDYIYLNNNQNNLWNYQKKLSLCTIHNSKGLEWEYVFILNCIDEYIKCGETYLRIKLKKQIKLMYVAVTRCRFQLFLCFQQNFSCFRYFSKILQPDKSDIFELYQGSKNSQCYKIRQLYYYEYKYNIRQKKKFCYIE